MGIDLHNLGLLAHAHDLGASFARTVGIGRQAVFVDPPELQRFQALRGLAPLAPRSAEQRYFEPLLKEWFGAARVDSIDASPYESATLVHDMNLPLPAAFCDAGGYDAVLDFGCLEHVFSFPVAWRNCAQLCRVGGHLLHALPANNLAGHGFYQFSPELFFNLYRQENGFELRGLWLAMKADARHWWRVADPRQLGRRVTLLNAHETYLLVIARKLRESGPMAPPQQSDYAEQAWQGRQASAAPAGRAAEGGGRRDAARLLGALGLLDPARRLRDRSRALRASSFSLPAPDYERVVVEDLLRPGSAR